MPVSQFRTNAISSCIRAVREPNPTQGSALRSERNAGRCSPTAPILADLTVDGSRSRGSFSSRSAKPPAFDRQGSTVDNPIDFNSELRAEALELVKATASLIDTSNPLSPDRHG